ncbi:MAG: hypothetical protein ACR2LX_10185 [Jatrophihabitans sp.]
MNELNSPHDLKTLQDAFETLERRADAALASAQFTIPTLSPRHRTTRVRAPAVAVAAVAVTAGAVAIWSSGSGTPSNQVGGSSPSAPPTSATPTTVAPTSAAATPPAHSGGRYQPPSTSDELTARARSILAGIATITVIPDEPTSGGPSLTGTPQPSASVSLLPVTPSPTIVAVPDLSPLAQGRQSGAAIRGTLTASGRSGGYDLDVFATTPGSSAICEADTQCSVHRLGDGSSLAVGMWRDSQAVDGFTYQIEVVRPDGADVLLHLSTEVDPKGMSNVTADRLPLTEQQMIDFVTSKRW